MKNTGCATKSKRIHRMAELIQSTLAHVLQKEVHDPRLTSATITYVDVSPDCCNATVLYSVLDHSEKNIRSVENAFKKANSFFRLQLSQLAELRYTPKLSFKFDRSAMDAERISQLLSKE